MRARGANERLRASRRKVRREVLATRAPRAAAHSLRMSR